MPKVLGEGRSRLGQALGEGRLVEGGLVVQYRCTVDTTNTANTADNTIHTMHTTVQD